MWEEVKIKDICEILGGIPAPKDVTVFKDDGIPFVRMRDLGRYHLTTSLTQTDSRIDYTYAKNKKIKLIPQGAVLIPRSGSVALNHRAILGQDSIIVSHICALLVKNPEKISNRYLYYSLGRIDMSQIAKKTTGLDSINNNDLGNLTISYPNLETQNKIVAILDKIKAISNKRQETIAKYDELQRALFLDMFGDPIINPKEWKKYDLKKVAKLERGRFSPRPRNNPLYFNGKFPFIQTGDIANSNYRLSNFTQTLNEKGIAVSKKFKIGDIVIAIVGSTIGVTSILEIDVYATDSIIAIKPDKDIVNNVFLEMLLRFHKNIIVEKAPEVARANINLSILGKVECITPPLDLQEKFSHAINKIEKLKVKNTEHFEETEILFKAISQLAFKGELDFNTAVDLEMLLENDYTFFKENSNKETIKLLLKRLDKDELNDNKFYDQRLYDKAKEFVFELLKDDKIKQVFDNRSKRVKLTV